MPIVITIVIVLLVALIAAVCVGLLWGLSKLAKILIAVIITLFKKGKDETDKEG